MAKYNPEVKPKDDFKEKHPNYRNFFVDPEPPLKAPLQKAPKLNWKELLCNYEKEKGHPLLPVNNKDIRLRRLKYLSAESVVLPQNIFILMMVKSAPSLSVRSALPSLKYTFVNGIRLNIFALTVTVYFIFGKNEKMSLLINATITDSHPF